GVNVTDVSGRLTYRWIDDARIMFMKDDDGDENYDLYLVDVASGEGKALTNYDKAQVRFLGQEGNRVLYSVNNRTPAFHDVYLLDVDTGESTLVEKNTGFYGYVADNALRPRVGIKVTATGTIDLWSSAGDGQWKPWIQYGAGDEAGISIGFDAENKRLISYDSRDRNTTAIVAVVPGENEVKVLAEDPRVDISESLVDPRTHAVLAYASEWLAKEWRAIDQAVAPDLEYLTKFREGNLSITSTSRDNRKWLVRYTLSDAPETYYLYDRDEKQARELFNSSPELAKLPLARLHPALAKSRNGFDLVGYYMLPRWSDPDMDGKPDSPQPMVMIIHGGPSDERVQYGFYPMVQWLANRGYAAFIANFRGSPGFGKRFLNAQDLEWGGKMNDDIIDQVNWAVEHGIADKSRIGVMGGSYGGYATLAAITFTPDVFACGFDVVGPSNLETFAKTAPAHWSVDHLAKRIGDLRTEEGRAHLRARSPFYHIDQITKPLLIAQGANDPRVVQAESDQIVKALAESGKEVTYLLYPDEGHGFARPENNRSMFAIAEVFFAKHLGGRHQPLTNELKGSSVQVPEGAERIAGLREALERRHSVK
ncbi:MAG: S9 family peptidase, partial [Candidatus Hydrogenedentota bacterium]